MTDDLDNLRPEVREACAGLDAEVAPAGRVSYEAYRAWCTINAELLRLANENFMLNRINVAPFKQELDGERMHVAALTARCQRVEAELADLKTKYAELDELSKNTVQCLREQDDEADRNAAELAALKARIAEAPMAVVQSAPGAIKASFHGYGCFEYTAENLQPKLRGKRVRLVVEE